MQQWTALTYGYWEAMKESSEVECVLKQTYTNKYTDRIGKLWVVTIDAAFSTLFFPLNIILLFFFLRLCIFDDFFFFFCLCRKWSKGRERNEKDKEEITIHKNWIERRITSRESNNGDRSSRRLHIFIFIIIIIVHRL